jgi:ABC-type Mn2+/Zn2+ transport system ATPase subunit
MKFRRLQISGFKNLNSCDIEFPNSPLISAVIGSNGSGKSNLTEAIIQILIGFYFEKPPKFQFKLEFVTQNREVVLERILTSVQIHVDGERIPLDAFARRLRDGQAQVFYPELTLIYYSGECRRVEKLISRYSRHFQKITREPDTDRQRPLFVQSSNQQSKIILLSLFAHKHNELLRMLRLEAIQELSLNLRSPEGFDPDRDEPKLWNTQGSIRRIVAAIDETADRQTDASHLVTESDSTVPTPRRGSSKGYIERKYEFSTGKDGGLEKLAERLAKSGDNLYLALEALRSRSLFRSVKFEILGRDSESAFDFDQLSEGEKQLLAVIGALKLTNQNDNLVLLDEPDTHLNPGWSWEYPSMLGQALGSERQRNSTVLMATHDPVMISGMLRDQVLLAHSPSSGKASFTRPVRDPRGQGVANLLCSREFFGLPSSLDKETQRLMDERLELSLKGELTAEDKRRLARLNELLQIVQPGLSEWDPEFVEFLRSRRSPS